MKKLRGVDALESTMKKCGVGRFFNFGGRNFSRLNYGLVEFSALNRKVK